MLPHIFAYFLVNLFNLFDGEGQCFFKEVSFRLGILYSFCALITLFLLWRYLPSEGSFEAFIKYLRVLLFNFDLLIYRRNNLRIYNLLGCIKLILGSIELIPLFWVDLYWSVLLLCGLLYSKSFYAVCYFDGFDCAVWAVDQLINIKHGRLSLIKATIFSIFRFCHFELLVRSSCAAAAHASFFFNLIGSFTQNLRWLLLISIRRNSTIIVVTVQRHNTDFTVSFKKCRINISNKLKLICN